MRKLKTLLTFAVASILGPTVLKTQAWVEASTSQPASKANALDAIVAELKSAGGDATKLNGVVERYRSEWAFADTLVRDTSAVEQVIEDLSFRPTMEAATPPGWPAFTPVGEVELKQYPLYRMAVIEQSAEVPEGAFFWQLFNHIQKNQVEMTAPVEMHMKDGERRDSMTAMAFLYEHAEQGAIGEDGKVKVVDVEPYQSVNVGRRGEPNAAGIESARAQIAAWLEANPGFVADGDYRVLGYNSPMMRDDRKYYEVQQPVKAADANAPATQPAE
jgi:hypothetical protein